MSIKGVRLSSTSSGVLLCLRLGMGWLTFDKLRPLQKGIFLPPALFANAHLLLNKLRFAAKA